jgi:poly(3-hydroxybutyrate) depolymerase
MVQHVNRKRVCDLVTGLAGLVAILVLASCDGSGGVAEPASSRSSDGGTGYVAATANPVTTVDSFLREGSAFTTTPASRGARIVLDGSAIYVERAGARHLLLAPARFERGDEDHMAEAPLDGAVDGARLTFERDVVQDWYEQRAGGLEQGWRVRERLGLGESPLRVVLELGPEVTAARTGPTTISLAVAGIQVEYRDLFALDATGATVEASMELEDGAIVLVVRDQAAAFPLTIDPLVVLSASTLPIGGPNLHGTAISVDGTRAVVGVPDMAASDGYMGGAVQVYHRTGANWAHVRTIRIIGSGAANFGAAVDVHRSWMVVGAPGEDSAPGDSVNEGAIYVINLDGIWNGLAPMPRFVRRIPGPASGVWWGTAVAISNLRVAAGTGYGGWPVHTFDHIADGDWQTTITAARTLTTAPGGNFGVSFDLDRNDVNHIVVGAPTHSTTGRVLSYRWTGAAWTTTPVIISPSTVGGTTPYFGVSVAVDRARVVAAALDSTNHAVLRRSSFNGLNWPAATTQVTSTSTLATPISYGTPDLTPHVAIGRSQDGSGVDVMVLGFPNGTLGGSIDAAPAVVNTGVHSTCPGCADELRGRAVATDGVSALFGLRWSAMGLVDRVNLNRSFTTVDASPPVYDVVSYDSDDSTVRGWIAAPDWTNPHPLLVWNHGGINDPLGPAVDLVVLNTYLALGYAVVAPQYRGVGGSGGAIEGCLGEVTDTLEMLDVALAQPWVNPSQVYMLGWSHGGCVTERAVERGARLNAAVAFAPQHYWDALEPTFTNPIHDPAIGSPSNPGRFHMRDPNFHIAGLTTTTGPGYQGQWPVRLMISHGAIDSVALPHNSCLLALSIPGFTSWHVNPVVPITVLGTNPPPSSGSCVDIPYTTTGSFPLASFPGTRYLVIQQGVNHGPDGFLLNYDFFF